MARHGEVRWALEANDSNMANVRDSDTSLWLHNKLGTSNDSWTGSSICSQLNAEVLRNIKDCFPDLQTQVKLKLLLSFFHIPRRNVEEVSVCLLVFYIFEFSIIVILWNKNQYKLSARVRLIMRKKLFNLVFVYYVLGIFI